jgi:hypothetical protein
LNDHLVLCTGSNFTTHVSGQQGYNVSGTLTADTLIASPNVTTLSIFSYGSVTLTYGIWLILGNAGFQNTANGTITCAQVGINGSSKR